MDPGVETPVRPGTPLNKATRGITNKYGTRIARSSAKILKEWFEAHVDNPYPTPEEYFDLVQQSHLTITQVKNWFTNKRRRTKADLHRGQTIPPNPGTSGGITDQLSILDRWKSSPPENDGVEIGDLIRASKDWRPFDSTAPPTPLLESDDSDISMFRTPSGANSLASDSSDGRSSQNSQRSGSRERTHGSFGRRRRRRKLGKSVVPEKAPQARRFQCTFCTALFPTKYDWARHEKTIHLNLESWVCSLESIPIAEATSTGMEASLICVFCDVMNPTAEHIRSHNFEACLEESDLAVRTFTRKDHLCQHLKLVHGAKFHPSMKRWLRDLGDSITSTCGFCSIRLFTWTERTEHLALHYREGLGIECWVGDWGFEPDVAERVEEAIAPYLIHARRYVIPHLNESNAFSYQQTTAVFTADPNAIGRDEPLHHGQWLDDLGYLPSADHPPLIYSVDGYQIEMRLVAQIQEVLDAGLPFPSDEEVRKWARVLVYGDPDPWNSTLADNAHWLVTFKIRHGLSQ